MKNPKPEPDGERRAGMLRGWLRASGAPLEWEDFFSLNCRPLDHLHDSLWPEALPSEWRGRIKRSRFAVGHLNRSLVGDLGWETWLPDDLSPATLRILQISPDRMDRLLVEAGIFSCARLIGRTVDGGVLRELKGRFGDSVVQLARKFVGPRIPVLPEALAPVAWGKSAAGLVPEAGGRLVAAAVSDLPRAVWVRVVAKCPSGTLMPFPGSGADPATLRSTIQLILDMVP